MKRDRTRTYADESTLEPEATAETVTGPLRDLVGRLQARAAASRQALELRSAEEADVQLRALRRLVEERDWEAIRQQLARAAAGQREPAEADQPSSAPSPSSPGGGRIPRARSTRHTGTKDS